jgi:hypothetical protein
VRPVSEDIDWLKTYMHPIWLTESVRHLTSLGIPSARDIPRETTGIRMGQQVRNAIVGDLHV